MKSAFKLNNIHRADVTLLHVLWMTKLQFARHSWDPGNCPIGEHDGVAEKRCKGCRGIHATSKRAVTSLNSAERLENRLSLWTRWFPFRHRRFRTRRRTIFCLLCAIRRRSTSTVGLQFPSHVVLRARAFLSVSRSLARREAMPSFCSSPMRTSKQRIGTSVVRKRLRTHQQLRDELILAF